MGEIFDKFKAAVNLEKDKPGFDIVKFGDGFIANIDQPTQPVSVAPKRGIIGDVAASVGRGAISIPQMALEAVRALDKPGGVDTLRNILTPAIKKLEKFKPEISRETKTSGFRRAITGGIESALPSIAPIATGAAIGSIVPGIGTAIGAGVGAVAGALGFGASEIDRVRAEGEQHIKDNNLNEADTEEFRKIVNIAALKSGGVEAGGELVGNLIVAATAGTLAPFKLALKAPIKGTIGAIFKQPTKQLISKFGQALAGEGTTEFSQAYLQNKFRKDIGLTDADSLDSALDVLGATAVTTLLFFGGAKGINISQKLKIKKALQNATIDPARRQDAVNNISNVITEVDGDTERADVFQTLGTIFVDNNQVIPLDATPAQLFDLIAIPTQEERIATEAEIPLIARQSQPGIDFIGDALTGLTATKRLTTGDIESRMLTLAQEAGGVDPDIIAPNIAKEALIPESLQLPAKGRTLNRQLAGGGYSKSFIAKLTDKQKEVAVKVIAQNKKERKFKSLSIEEPTLTKEQALHTVRHPGDKPNDQIVSAADFIIGRPQQFTTTAITLARRIKDKTTGVSSAQEAKKREASRRLSEQELLDITGKVILEAGTIQAKERIKGGTFGTGGTQAFDETRGIVVDAEQKLIEQAIADKIKEEKLIKEQVGIRPIKEKPIKNGKEWKSDEGDRKIVGELVSDGVPSFTVSTKGQTSKEVIPKTEIAKTIELDIKLAKAQELKQLAVKTKQEQKRVAKEKEIDIEGFAEGKTLLQKGRIRKILNQKGLRKGKFIRRKDLIKDLILNKNYTLSEAGTKRKLIIPDGTEFLSVNKTEFEFATFLSEKPVIGASAITAQKELETLEPQISSLSATLARTIKEKNKKPIRTELQPLLDRRKELREIISPTPPSVTTARKNIKSKLGGIKAGVDPTVLKDMFIVGNHHFIRGAKTFLSWSKSMVKDFGASIKRFLRQIWDGMSKESIALGPIVKEPIIKTITPEVGSATAIRLIAINEVNKENKSRAESKSLFVPAPDRIAPKFKPKFVGRPLNSTQQGVFDRKINPMIEAETSAQKLDRTLTGISLKLRTGIVDKYAPISIVSPKIGKMLSVINNPVGALLTLFRHGPLKLTEQIFDAKFDEGGKGLKDVIKTLGPELESFLGWITANRANKLFPLGKERNLTKDEISEMLKLNQGKMADGRNRPKVYESVRKQLMELNSNVLDIVQEMGLIDKEERKTWEEDFYIPFFRQLAESDAEVAGPRNIKGLVNKDAVKQLKGSPVPIADMLGNIVLNWSHLLSAAAHNQIGRLTLEEATHQKFTDDQKVAEKIVIPEFKIKKADDGTFEVIDEELKSKGKGFETKQEAEERIEDLGNRFIASQKKVDKELLYVRETGKKIWYRVNVPILHKALLGLHEKADNGRVMKVMRTFKRMLTFSVTFSPEFKIRNLIRDSVSAIAVSPVSMNIYKNIIQGAKGVKEGTLADVRKRAGGGEILFGHTMGTADERLSAMLERELDISSVVTLPTGAKKLASEFKKYLRWWNDKGSQLENINRSAIFEQEINKENGSFLEANYQARDVLNFERHGAYSAIKFLIDVVPFLNARIQGLDKLRRGFIDPAQRNQLIAVTGMVAVASSLLYLAYKDDDDFKTREDWDRDTYWWFKLPGSEVAFRIPKPFEIGVFGTLAERMAEQAVDDKAHGELFRERFMFAVRETFSFNIIPQVFSPALELAINKNFFTDRPIESKTMQTLSPSQRKRAWTSETAIVLSTGFDKILWDKAVLSPVQIEHLIQGYLGWLGATILSTIDQVFTQPIGGFPSRPTKRIEQFPLIGSFARVAPAVRTRFETIFYEQLNEINQVYADIRNFRTLGELDKAIQLARKNRDKLKFRKLLNNRQRRLSAINKRISRIRSDKDMPKDEKRIKIDRQLEIKNRLLRITVERIT